MMRCLTMDQKKLYEYYYNLSEKIIEKGEQQNKSLNEIIWAALSKEGIWALPVDKTQGGKGKSWQDVVVAMDGVFAQYFDTNLLSTFISQVSAIYLISQYGTNIIKDQYFPRLMEGEIITVYHQYSNAKKKINKTSALKKIDTCIYIREIDKNILFYIYEKNSHRINDEKYQSLKPILTTKNIFIAKDLGVSALHDLIDFERLFYAVISASFANKIRKKFPSNNNK